MCVGVTDEADHNIFLSYRRSDSGGYVGWLHQLLVERLGEAEVFRDVDSLQGGERWVDRLHDTLERCDVLVAVIGQDWLDAANERGRRLDDPEDRVRLEIEAGIRRGVVLIPTLVGGARMPRPEQLPDSLRPLCDWQSVRMSDESWQEDLADLFGAIERALETPAGELPVGTMFARHVVEVRIGRGGMGIVYRARHVELGRVDALKLISPHLARDSAFRNRFVRESRIASSLKHPNVVTVYDHGEEAGFLYLTMELIEGGDLARLLREQGRLEPARAAQLLAPVADALQAAHDRGLVHRDVKPGNILIERRVNGEHVYLGDFGLARETAASGGVTSTGHWIGTADYVSPEQVMGEHIDGRADVYALGCVLFEMLCGRVPYPVRSETAKLVAHATKDPPAPSSIAPELPTALDELVLKAMARVPAQRVASAEEFGRQLLAAVAPDVDPEPIVEPEPVVEPLPRVEQAPAPAIEQSADQPPEPDRSAPKPAPSPTREPQPATKRPAVSDSDTAQVPSARSADAEPGRRKSPEQRNAGVRTPVRPLAPLAGVSTRKRWIGAGVAAVTAVTVVVVLLIISSGSGSSGVAGTTIAVGAGNGSIAFGPRELWVSKSLKNVVERFNWITGATIGAPIKTGKSPSPMTFAHGDVWVSNYLGGSVTRIDASSGNAIGAPIPVGPKPGNVAAVDGSLWVSSYTNGSVTRINPSTGKVIATVAVGKQADEVFGYGQFPVVLTKAGLVTIDPTTDAKLGHAIGDPIALNSRQHGVTKLGEDLWFLYENSSETSESVRAINFSTGQVVGHPIDISNDSSGIAAWEGKLWVTTSTGSVVEIDPDTSKIIGSPIKIAGIKGSNLDYPLAGDGGLWVVFETETQKPDDVDLFPPQSITKIRGS
jgi:serine/threonine protein kinase